MGDNVAGKVKSEEWGARHFFVWAGREDEMALMTSGMGIG
jgi:hypothetical protein